MESKKELEPKIEELIGERKWIPLRETLAKLHVPEITDLLTGLPAPDRILVFRILPREIATDVFSSMDSHHQNTLLKHMTDDETQQLLTSLKPDDRTNLFEELPGRATQKLVNLLSPEDLEEAMQLLGYPEESVGRLMTPDYVAVRPYWTIKEALGHIKSKGKDSETIDMVYITDESWKLLDSIELRKFILADPQDTVEKIMDYTYASLSAFEDREKAVEMMQRYDVVALPVVGTDGILLGIVTVDDVMDVAQKEVTEDFHKTAAVVPLRLSYRKSSVWSLYHRRVGWLVILIFFNLISSSVIEAYEATLASAITLAYFIPMLIGSGGNAGAQSAALMIRALATGDVKMTQWARTLVKELGIGVSLGVTLGLASWFLGIFKGDFEIGIIVGLTMASIILVTNIIGVMLPFILSRLKIDPAIASSPLITSIADATGLIIYFSIATWIFST